MFVLFTTNQGSRILRFQSNQADRLLSGLLEQPLHHHGQVDSFLSLLLPNQQPFLKQPAHNPHSPLAVSDSCRACGELIAHPQDF